MLFNKCPLDTLFYKVFYKVFFSFLSIKEIK